MSEGGHFRVEEESGALEGMTLDEYLVENPAAAFVMRVETDALRGLGVNPGDLAIVDRSIAPQRGDLVVAVLDGEFVIRRFDDLSGAGKTAGETRVEAVVRAVARKYR